MPELPEVEVTRRGIAPHVTGRRIERVDVRVPALRWPVPPTLPTLVGAQVIEQVRRRGKYLMLESDSGWQIVHLGMSGSLRILPGAAPTPATKHDHVDWYFGDFTLRLRDPRRFGALLWHPRAEGDVLTHPLLARLGVEPLGAEFTGALLRSRLAGRAVSIKQALLAGDVVVGVGNIYASESLFRAGIRPTTAAGRVSLARCERLAEAIRQTLSEAIEKGGSTLRDFFTTDGSHGWFQLTHFVYDRAGSPCRVCATPIKQLVQGQRSTYFCAQCQR